MRRLARPTAALAVAALLFAGVQVPSAAAARPVVTRLSLHSATYWGGMRVTVSGRNLTHVTRVTFGATRASAVHEGSGTALTVTVPQHGYGRIHVRVTTTAGTSSAGAADVFTFTRPTMNSPILGGLTGRQEQRISARVRAAHHTVPTARPSAHWTSAMGRTAVRRAASWLGLPYSWAGGNSRGPTKGVCAHNGGDLDCHVVGFDCSGLALYAWAPYKKLVHLAANQYKRAGTFHPAIGQLVAGDLVFFSGYIAHGIGHVAVYEGGGLVIQAEQSGTQVMRSRLVDVIAGSGVYRGATRTLASGRREAAPRVSSVTRQVPAQGGYVTITGSRLGDVLSVTVGGTTLYRFAAHSATRIVVKVPAHRAGAVTLAVSNAWSSAARTLTYVAAPVVTALSPGQGPVSGGTTVTLTGSGLTGVDEVEVGATRVEVRASTARTLTFTMPAHAAGVVPVRVRSPFGLSNPRPYTFVVPSPPTSSPAPSSAAPSSPAPTSPTPSSPAPTPSTPTSSAPAPDPTSSQPGTGPPPTPTNPGTSASAATTSPSHEVWRP